MYLLLKVSECIKVLVVILALVDPLGFKVYIKFDFDLKL